MLNLNVLIQNGKTVVNQNASTILTAVGVVGVVTTAVLTGKAAVKATELCRDHEEAFPKVWENKKTSVITREKLGLTWQCYISPVASGVTTIGCIVAGHRLDAKKAAALAAAYGLSEKRLQEYKDKVLEKMGVNKERAVRDEVVQDRVNATPGSNEVIIGTSNVLCFDVYSGRYFESNMEEIRQAVNTVNSYILDHEYASLSHFYDEINIPPTGMSDEVGWKSADLIEVGFSTVMSPDKRPCLAMDFNNRPIAEYTAVYG